MNRTFAYSSRGAFLTQSRKCLISEGAVARWKRLGRRETGGERRGKSGGEGLGGSVIWVGKGGGG